MAEICNGKSAIDEEVIPEANRTQLAVKSVNTDEPHPVCVLSGGRTWSLIAYS